MFGLYSWKGIKHLRKSYADRLWGIKYSQTLFDVFLHMYKFPGSGIAGYLLISPLISS